MVTDYSSIATEAAIAGVPVAYFQFDRRMIFGPGHTFDEGWFDYVQHGFGPVFEQSAHLSRWFRVQARNQWRLDEKYADRLKRILPFLDGKASERVFREIVRLDSPLFDFEVGNPTFKSK
ncbi:CDP-glycerol glycerophosphotransferase family protein [Glutamicibacter nicotianae]|uniref:CDP-glycerol glycerophosphotransferase family protein n=1 Tax=Glutamicibacter nicotianae TaxID=37929 RepID=UPI001CBEFD2C